MDSDMEELAMETTTFRRKSETTEDVLSNLQRLCAQKKLHDPDLELLCSDGSLSFYQFVLASNSEFMRSLLGRFQEVEFSIGDWQHGEMFLLDRRISSRSLELSVPDFERDQVRLMLDLLINGSVTLKNKAEVRTLMEILKVFKIDSISSLESISEVNLTDKSSTVSIRNEFSKLDNIKKEITEQADGLVAFRSELEVECDLCKERFQDESDLMRHMDYIHQATNMHNKISYKRPRKSDSDHPKRKGKGKGKKSIETKPVRKENQNCGAEAEEETEQLSDSNSGEDFLPPMDDDIVMSEPEITFRISELTEDSTSIAEGAKSNKRIILERKRKFCAVENDKICSSKKSKEKDEADSGDKNYDTENLTWEDIGCVYCNESISMTEDRPGQNRKKYQTHLLNHFHDTQYQDVPEGLRVYRCSYKDCSYFTSSKNPYIQHIAFKHDEWFKRINKRILSASTDPSIAEELEDLSAVKEAFITDSRIIVSRGSSKPLWVEGVALGRESEAENNIDNVSRSGSSLSKSGERTSIIQSEQRSAGGEVVKPQEKKKKVKVDPYLQCHLCSMIMKTDPEKIMKNRHSYQVHLIEAHFESSQYRDIADQEKYFCPRSNCTYPGTELKSRMRYHLAIHHKEFHERCRKRIKDIETKPEQTDMEKDCLKKIKSILVFFDEDSRVVDHEMKDRIRLESPRDDDKETSSGPQTEEKRDEDIVTTNIKKEREDRSEVRVEMSEEFSAYLRAGSIKSEPIEDIDDEKEKDGKSEKENGKQSRPQTSAKKTKKNKKDFKSQNLRKQQAHSDTEEESIKIEDDVEKTKIESVKESTGSNLQSEEIQKLHEDIVNSHPLPITIHDDDDDQLKQNETANESSKANSKDEAEPSDVEYSCKACHEIFQDRPLIIMHIIGEHLIDKFEVIPVEDNGKFHCPYTDTGCTYSTDKKHGILAHLTLKHSAIKITDVTDYIIHKEKQATPPVEKIAEVKQKQEVSTVMPVEITSEDSADITWKCKSCKKSFRCEDLARQHVILDHLIDNFKNEAPVDRKIFVCDHCNKYSTISRINFIKHLGMNHHLVSEETFAEYIEQTRSLLLDIDVIKCRCDKKFDKQRQLREHIIFSHCKKTFNHIPKGRAIYSCKDYYPSCNFAVKSRVTFIKHLVSKHQILSEQEIKSYMPSSVVEDVISVSGSSSIESRFSDGFDDRVDQSSIGFDDSVSQAANRKGADPVESPPVIELDEDQGTTGQTTPFANNSSHSCPVCFKLIAQRSNFEDHLETHGIGNEAVFFCSDCDIATSFAGMYHHLSAHHKENPSTEVTCLPCNQVFSQTPSRPCLRQLKDHCISKVSRLDHKAKVGDYLRRPQETLHQFFKFSCQTCSMYFMSSEDLMNHGTIFNSRCDQIKRKTKVQPVFTCHLCNFSKISSQFNNHCKGIQHQHKVTEESSNHKSQFGLSSRDQYYICDRCNIAGSFNNIRAHIEESPGCARNIICGLCSVKVTNLQRHVISDGHRKEISKLKLSSKYDKEERKYFQRFCYLCNSCSFSFQTYEELAGHDNCPKKHFTCKRCRFSCQPQDFQKHLESGCPGQDSGLEIIEDSPMVEFVSPGQQRQETGRKNLMEESIIEVIPLDPSVLELEPGRKSPGGESILEIFPPDPSVLEMEPVPSTSTAGERKRCEEGERRKVFVYLCETCKMKFTDGRKFQSHALSHDSQPGVTKLHCIVCPWTITADKVSHPVTSHLLSNKHRLQLARKMSSV